MKKKTNEYYEKHGERKREYYVAHYHISEF